MHPTFSSNLFTVDLYQATGMVSYLPDPFYHNKAHVAGMLTTAAMHKKQLVGTYPELGSLWDELKIAILHSTAVCKAVVSTDKIYGVYPDLEAAERATGVLQLGAKIPVCNVNAAARAVLLCRKPVQDIGDNLLAGVLHDLLMTGVCQYASMLDVAQRLDDENNYLYDARYARRTRKKLEKYCAGYVEQPECYWCTSVFAAEYLNKLKVRSQELLDSRSK